MVHIGIMVAALLVSLIGYLWYRNRGSMSLAGGTASAANAGVKDPNDARGYTSYGGIDFVTTPSVNDQKMAAAGATSYDLTDPATAIRRNDAINRAEKLENIAASRGQTVDELYQAHLQTQLVAEKAQTQSIATQAAAAGFNKPLTPQNEYLAMTLIGPKQNDTQPPGTYWDYGQGKWVPLYF